MSISQVPDSQKVDYLWKKIGFGAAKTDISGNVDATQEPFPSPLQIRADKIMQQSSLIPSIIPSSNTSVVTVFTSSFPIQCTNDSGITTPTLTWETGQTFWIPPEFGPTYQIKAWIAPSGNAANVASKGTQIFATGSGNNDEWFFDYQSGILQFNGNNTPYSGGNPISFTGNSVYISGAVYSGAFGLPTYSNIANVILGEITFTNNIISTSDVSGNIFITAPGTGIVQITGNDALGIPAGNTSVRPTGPQVGYTRFNTDSGQIETWNGATWVTPGQATISSDIINPNGSSNVYTLSSNSTTTGVMVSINGTLQQPYTSYNIVSNNQIQFSEIPLTTDVIEVRHITVNGATVSSYELINGTTEVLLDTANVNITGNVLPTSNVAYDLGSPTLRWRTGYFSASTIDLGGSTIGVTNNAFVFTSNGVTQTLAANGVSSANSFSSSNVTVSGNLTVNGNLTVLGTTTSVNTEIINQSEIVTGNISAGNITVNSSITASTILAGIVNSPVIGNSGALLTGTLQTASQPNVTTLAGLTNVGNGGSISVNGNLNVTGGINFTGNVNQINITGNSGQFFGNINGFGALYAGVGTGYVVEPQTILQLSANYNGYSQLNIQNVNSGNVASTDLVATADAGNTSQYYIDMGINSSTYNQSGYSLTAPLDGYLYVQGNIVTGVGGNLIISTSNTGADIVFATGGQNTTNQIGRFSNSANAFQVTGNITATGSVNGAGVRQTTSNTVPSSAFVGDQWYDTSTDILFQYEYDGTNHVWVDISSVALNTNVAIITGVSISVSSNASVGTTLAVGQSLTVNQSNVATAIVNGGVSGAGNIGAQGQTFNTVFALASSAQYADLAEIYVSDNNYSPGTVVIFGGDQEITISTTDHDSAVAGVISANPAYIMNNGIEGLPVALQGRVPCQVQGPINKGELVVTSNTPGIAQRLDQTKWRPGCVIGKSLETINNDIIATIEVVVGRD